METNTPHFGFALEPVDDLQAAKRFYVEVMGAPVNSAQKTQPLM